MSGFIIAAPSSRSGKTTLTLGILRALANRRIPVKPAKSGPDYIDPQFHAMASWSECVNLDAWAMRPERILSLAATDKMLVVEGAMGLFDGAAPDGHGSTADLARILRLPVILVIDASAMSQSVAALALGFARYDPEVKIAGVILNNVGSERHSSLLHRALADTGLPILGAVPRDPKLNRPSRHLGLVQAKEHSDLESFISRTSGMVETHIDIDAILEISKRSATFAPTFANTIPPPAQRISIARDQAFSFMYPHVLADWKARGAALQFFSPLADEPVPEADFIFLPGGYPELHAPQISAASTFLSSLRAASQDTDIYGECGGYMILGQGLTNAYGRQFKMAGLLPLETSFEDPIRQLGYRQLSAVSGPFKGNWRAHEFHYCTTTHTEGQTLFTTQDAANASLPDMGLIKGNVSGSFAHLIDRA